MGVRQIRGKWILDYYYNGKRIREKVTIDGVVEKDITKALARKVYAIRKAQVAEGKFNLAEVRKTPLFAKFANRYLEEYSKINKMSWKRDEQSMKHLNKFFGNKRISQISPFSVQSYKSKRSKEKTWYGKPITKATVNRELACLRAIMNMAIDAGYMSENPVSKAKLFKEDTKINRVLTEEEFIKLLNHSAKHLKYILEAALFTGMRLSEVLNLRWQDINISEGYLVATKTKNGEMREIPINENLKMTFEQIERHPDSDFVFTKNNGEKFTSIKTAFKSAIVRAGIEPLRFHDLRHSFASHLVMNGVDLVTVKELLGHKSINMTMRYSHPTTEHKVKAVNSLRFNRNDLISSKLEMIQNPA